MDSLEEKTALGPDRFFAENNSGLAAVTLIPAPNPVSQVLW